MEEEIDNGGTNNRCKLNVVVFFEKAVLRVAEY
jgi:hypothetical protein